MEHKEFSQASEALFFSPEFQELKAAIPRFITLFPD